MTTFSDMTPDDQERLETASAWNLRLEEDPSLEFSDAFLKWRAEPDNERALHVVEKSRSALMAISAEPDVLALRGAVLARAGRIRMRPPRRFAMMGALAASFVLVSLAGGYYVFSRQPAAYTTDIGERRIVSLSDGSRLSLDSDTEVEVHFTKQARLLTLDRGRARFDVAHDVTRPFMVTAGDQTVIAVGTSFSVERLGSKVLVTLMQGRVVIKDAAPVSPQKKAPPAVALAAGQELVAVAEKRPSVAPVDLKTADAWEAGRLVFSDEPLSEAVDRVNRYTQQPITVDPAIASLRISGGFNAGDVGSFVASVTSFFPVQATTTDNNGILLQPRARD